MKNYLVQSLGRPPRGRHCLVLGTQTKGENKKWEAEGGVNLRKEAKGVGGSHHLDKDSETLLRVTKEKGSRWTKCEARERKGKKNPRGEYGKATGESYHSS